MVNIVIVSHSARIAEGVKELVAQVAPPELKVFAAGGLDPETIGTNVEMILEALTQADNPEGTLVLVDLGSAILSAEAAVEMLPGEAQARLRICAAPLVEGAVAAGVQAGLGADLETVRREALAALAPKLEQLGEPSAPPLLAPTPETPSPGVSITLVLQNPHGLHARPAARFVRLAAGFEADVRVENLSADRPPAPARSLNRLAALGARKGDTIRIRASGPGAGEALEALAALAREGFGEGEEAERPPAAPEKAQPGGVSPIPGVGAGLPPGEMQAIPVSEGLALAPLAFLSRPRPVIDASPATDPRREWERLQAALESAARAIRGRGERLAALAGKSSAEIFEAHLLILRDPELLEVVRKAIFEAGDNAAHAWDRAIREAAAAYETLEDPYQRMRRKDVDEVGDEILFALAGEAGGGKTAGGESTAGGGEQATFDEPVILAAVELTPGQVARLDLEKVRGLVTLQGGALSHAGILARALGLPAVAGAPPALLELEPGTELALDGGRGLVWVRPAPPLRARIARERRAWLEQRRRLDESAQAPGATADGVRIEVAANVASTAEALAARRRGAEGVGVLRTEFLFQERASAPGEDEQIAALQPIFAALEGRPVIVRLLDAGGDKPLAYIDQPGEANPFLGVRGIRLLQKQPELLASQARAILRAGVGCPVRIMAPMVSGLDEVRFVRRAVETAHRQLEAEKLPHAWPVQLGVMVEVPSAALLAPRLAEEVDFLSIGTNDLTQYTLAAERGNPALAQFADALHPAVLKLIRATVEGAQGKPCWVGVCGEIAGDPAAAPILVGLGVRELSMNPSAIPQVKAALAKHRIGEAQRLAEQALRCEDAGQVRRLIEDATS